MPLADGGLLFIVYTPFPTPELKFAKTITVSLTRFRVVVVVVGSPGPGTRDLAQGLYSVFLVQWW